MTTIREEIFEREIVDYDERQLTKCVNFADHRFVSIERDALTPQRWVKGHKSLRGACNHLARVTEEGEPFVPEAILDLDTGEKHELDLFAFVAPRYVDAVAMMMPRGVAQALRHHLEAQPDLETAARVLAFLRQALDRRH